jgi:bifunctional non-homologous end joining protein LigD
MNMVANMAASPRSSLIRYTAKRHFDRTPEPRGGPVGRAKGNAFLIQKHDARRLHFDFRIELDGVLKSWAVTKGPSLDPAVRRLAVHVEDHPLAYGSFEGVIPAGQYGGGTVMLWDRGTWEPIGDPHKDYPAGKLKFTLQGERLKGGWMLIRMKPRDARDKGDNWLLVKERDEFAQPGAGDDLVEGAVTSIASGKSMAQIANTKDVKIWQSGQGAAATARVKAGPRKPAKSSGSAPSRAAARRVTGGTRAPLADFVAPELALLVDQPPDGDDWLHEIKIDGYRVYCRREHDDVRLLTRTGLDWTDRFRAIAEAVRELPGDDFALDGEIAVFEQGGQSNFGLLQDTLSLGRDDRLTFVVFDLLHLDGVDLREAPLTDRKRLLQELMAPVAKSARLRYSDHLSATGKEVLHQACQLALEGIVSKRAASPYRSGRGGDWVKSKCVARQEFVIGGFTEGRDARKGAIGALLLGWYEEEELRYAGRVGTGFSDKIARELRTRLLRLKTTQPPFAKLPPGARNGAIWVQPDLVCEVAFATWTRDGILRHASFQGLREDKPAKAIGREQSRKDPPPAKTATSANRVAGIAITHPDRVVYPDIGITKLAMAQYYAAVADWILPEISHRPLSLLRCPEGIGGQCFFQKHFATGVRSLDRVAIAERRGTGEYVVVRDQGDLIALVQEGIIEIHPWGARADDPEKPDRLVFDLDPAPEIAFSTVIEGARTVRGLLDQIGLVSFVKTTGGKGLHVVVPLRRKLDWPPIKAFARGMADTLVAANPGSFTANPLKRERKGKIFIDYLRNDRGSTAVAAYSLRARPGAPVAMPVAWDDLTRAFRPDRFTLATVPERLAARRVDPWRGIDDAARSLPADVVKSLRARA